MQTIHGSCVAIDGQGVLLLGPSGAGKSDLALRLIDTGAMLVADDRVALAVQDGAVHARAPDRLRGLLEIWGHGVVALPHFAEAPLALVIELKPRREMERMPDPAAKDLLGVAVPMAALDPWDISAAAKVRTLLTAEPLD